MYVGDSTAFCQLFESVESGVLTGLDTRPLIVVSFIRVEVFCRRFFGFVPTKTSDHATGAKKARQEDDSSVLTAHQCFSSYWGFNR